MILRAIILGTYVGFAILIGVVYGLDGLGTLLFLYFIAGAWAAFVLVWNRASRSAGAWHFNKLANRETRRAR